MATIGTFTKQDGRFTGTINTLTLKAKTSFEPVEKTDEKSPDFRVYANSVEIGAAWAGTSKNGNAYLAVVLDDTSCPNPIRCRLIEGEKSHLLLWSR